MTLDPRAIQIHTDGSAYRNPGHVSGCAVIVQYPEHLDREDEIIVDFGCPKSTNQRMELTACIEGLKWVRRNAPWDGVTCVLVVSDATYVTELVVIAPFWKNNGWRNREGQPILNSDLWDDLLKARAKAGIRVEFVWQAGKTTEIGKRVDKLAKARRNAAARTEMRDTSRARTAVRWLKAALRHFRIQQADKLQSSDLTRKRSCRRSKKDSASTCSMKRCRPTHQSSTHSRHA